MICSSTKSSQIKGCAQHPQKATLSLVIPRCICDVSQRFPSTAAFPAFALFGWKAGRYFSKVGNGRVECSRLEKITCCSRSQTGGCSGSFSCLHVVPLPALFTQLETAPSQMSSILGRLHFFD